MAEEVGRFPESGADGSGQVSPQLGNLWLPNDNGTVPTDFDSDFASPNYGQGIDDIHIPDYHPPEIISDHPFKVNRYYDSEEKKWKARVNKGRFFLTTNTIKTGGGGAQPLMAPSQGEVHDETGGGQGTVKADIFTVEGDDGFPSFANVASATTLAASTGSAAGYAKEFSDDNAKHGCAYLSSTGTRFDPEKDCYVYLRYILIYSTSDIKLASSENALNIIVVRDEEHAHVTSGAENKPISPAAVIDKADADAAEGETPDPVFHIMRPDPDPAIPSSFNQLSTGITGSELLRCGAYYIPLAKIAKLGTTSGPIITQYIHGDINLSVTNIQVTAYAKGHGSTGE
tara:strand:+ start:956 stop:1984 length:1029 start_codon:yes stop_codon:yes gene_type:complete